MFLTNNIPNIFAILEDIFIGKDIPNLWVMSSFCLNMMDYVCR